jgi:ABC-type Zn uptake system ZnuABC Zn-binding protein ZnuA
MIIRLLRVVVLFIWLAPLAAQAPAKLRVVATTSMIADMARNIAGNDLEVISLLPIGSDPHLYEATPADNTVVQSAQLILKNGLHLEGWLDRLIASSNKTAPVVEVTKGITPIQDPNMGEPDPHAWMDVTNAIIYATNIAEAFASADPAHAEGYRQRLSAYRAELEALDAYIREQMALIPAEHRVLITSHDAFHYFGRRYGLEVDATMGTSTDADVRTTDIARLSQLIESRGLPAIFVETTINRKLLDQLARDKKIRVGGSLYADSLGEPGSPGATYIGMMKHNTQVIVAALSAGSGTAETVAPGGGFFSYGLFILGGLVIVGTFLFVRKMM